MTGNTPVLSIPYPTGTDRVVDGDNAMQALAERVEARMGRGWVGYAESVSSQTVDVHLEVIVSLNLTLLANRRYRVSGECPWFASIPQGFNLEAVITMDAASISRNYMNSLGGNTVGKFTFNRIIVPSAGAHLFEMKGIIVAGQTGTFTANAETFSPAFILVEDIGPSVLS